MVCSMRDSRLTLTVTSTLPSGRETAFQSATILKETPVSDRIVPSPICTPLTSGSGVVSGEGSGEGSGVGSGGGSGSSSSSAAGVGVGSAVAAGLSDGSGVFMMIGLEVFCCTGV